MLTATYSPEDNKLRLYSTSRLDAETYQRVTKAGYKWAPVQQAFVAPMWTPERESLALELAGEIGDEDSTLMARAEERADRFEDYSEKRAADAESARKVVDTISEHIPLGQPILIGHHSERHARRDAERIENNMRRAVRNWETSEYWTRRAAAAVQHAKYKERPDVRQRRIKKLEAELRKQEKHIKQSQAFLKLWQQEGMTKEMAIKIANMDYCVIVNRATGERDSVWSLLNADKLTAEDAQKKCIAANERTITHHGRWADHYRNRIAYEKAMLADQGGTVADKNAPEKGGACICWASPRGGWSYIQKVNKVSVTVLDNWGNGGENFTRTIPFDKLAQIMSAAEVQQARDEGWLHEVPDGTGFILTGSTTPAKPTQPSAAPSEPAQSEDKAKAKADKAAFEAMRDTLKTGGVQVASVPQLFPTPAELAARMVELADIEPGQTVLEPSAGTGNLIRAIGQAADLEQIKLTAIEIHHGLSSTLTSAFGERIETRCADFLACTPEQIGQFDRIIMNPPFADAADIQHINHALNLLKPGGRLVAICANGPRQRERLIPLVERHGGEWEDLPAGTFKTAHTGVSTALLVVSV